MSSTFGGNLVKKIDLSGHGKHLLGQDPYEYYYFSCAPGDQYLLNELKSFSLFVLESNGLEVSWDGHQRTLAKFDAVQVEQSALQVVAKGNCSFLLAGMKQSYFDSKIEIRSENEIYRVEKPWGFELWVNGTYHPGYCLKKIGIKAGTKTSLQFHEFKRETNVIYQGNANLHFKSNDSIPNMEVTPTDIGQTRIDAVTCIDIQPKIIHRVEALTEILLYEVSTPHLDDVIRLQDDAKRPDGRVQEEHSKGKA